MTLAGPSGERTLPLGRLLHRLHDQPAGARRAARRDRGPGPDDPTAYLKFGRKHANTPAVVTVAARIAWDGDRVADARIALGAVGPHPIRARQAERLAGRDEPRSRRDRRGRGGSRRRNPPAVHRRDRHRVVPAPDDRASSSAARSSGWRRAPTPEAASHGVDDRHLRARRPRGRGHGQAHDHAPVGAAQPARAHRHEGGLPPGRLRQLHGPRRRRADDVLPAAGRGRRRHGA